MIKNTKIYECDISIKQPLPLYLSRIRAGFPSPADDYLDKKLDLNEHLIKHPASTFFVKVKGDSMVGQVSILVICLSLIGRLKHYFADYCTLLIALPHRTW